MYYNMKNYLFTPNLSSWWENRLFHWNFQLIFSPHKPIIHLSDIEVMVIIIKTCTGCVVTIYMFLQPTIFHFIT